MRPEPTAVGYLRKDISDLSLDWEQAQIRNIAKRLGYQLPKTVMFSAATDHPVNRLLNVVRHMEVDAVIAPSLAHFGGVVPDALVQICDLITVAPENTYARWAPSMVANERITGEAMRAEHDAQVIYFRARRA